MWLRPRARWHILGWIRVEPSDDLDLTPDITADAPFLAVASFWPWLGVSHLRSRGQAGKRAGAVCSGGSGPLAGWADPGRVGAGWARALAGCGLRLGCELRLGRGRRGSRGFWSWGCRPSAGPGGASGSGGCRAGLPLRWTTCQWWSWMLWWQRQQTSTRFSMSVRRSRE